MNIAFLVNGFPSISETFIVGQIVGLLERGHNVEIYADRPVPATQKVHADVERYRLIERTTYREVTPGAKLARIRSAASLVLRWGWRHPRHILDSVNVLRHGWGAVNLSVLHERCSVRYCKSRYDVIHCHFGPNGQRAVELREAGMFYGPVITTFHGYDVNLLPRIRGSGLYEVLFKHGDLFTVGSEFMRQRIMSLGAPRDRIVKLPMGVDMSWLRCAKRGKVSGAGFRLLTIARLVEVKGIEYGLRAVALLKNKCPDLRYQIAGNGPLRTKLEALTAKLGLTKTVEFLGDVSQEEVFYLYETAHGFVLPGVVTDSGEEEGQSVVLIEAQACGLPVIASSVGGIPETVRDGVSGLLVRPRDPVVLASAILWLVEHPEECGRMGRAGRAYVEENYDLEQLRDQLVDIYHTVIEHTRSARAVCA